MSNTKAVYKYSFVVVVAGIFFYVLKAKKDKRAVTGKRGKGSIYREVAHDIGEGLQEELEGLKNRLFR